MLADALAKLRQDRNDVHVRLAGTGRAAKEVKARARQLGLNGSLEFVGSYEGTVGCSAFMRTLDVFVLPSFAEGTSKSVIEAMAHGLPIITTNVGGSPDLLPPGAGILSRRVTAQRLPTRCNASHLIPHCVNRWDRQLVIVISNYLRLTQYSQCS